MTWSREQESFITADLDESVNVTDLLVANGGDYGRGYYYYYYYYYYYAIWISLVTGLFFLVLLLNQQ
jgi:hypothetical protein